MSREGRQFFRQYWNLPTVVMSDCSLIATRDSHAKHNQSVSRIPELRQKRLSSFRVILSANKKEKVVRWRGTYILFKWKPSMYSEPHANKNKLVTFLRANKTFEFLSKHKWKQKEGKLLLKRHLRPPIWMETIHEFQVTCQQTQVSHVSNTWAPTKQSCTSKTWNQ